MKLSEDGVSPVIGVILMVAITVILAAVIAVFVFNMTDDVQGSKTVAVTAKLQGNGTEVDDVVITYMGGPDDDKLIKLSASVDGADPPVVFGSGDKPFVGEKDTFPTVGEETTHTVIVVGEFSDGNSQVLLDTIL